MRHLNDGALRRMYDEPLAAEAGDRDHFHACHDCQRRFAGIAEGAREGAALLAGPGVTVDAQAAYARLRPALAGAPAPRRLPLRLPSGVRWRRPALAAALAAAVIAVVAATPLAASLKQIFEPTSVQPVAIGNGDLNALAPLAAYGDVKWTSQPELQPAADAAAAARASQLPAINPGYLPAGVSHSVQYGTVNQATGTFTFSSAKAAAEAARTGKSLPALPRNIDGSTLVLQVGPGQAAIYGDLSKLQSKAAEGDRTGQAPDAAGIAAGAGPMLAIAEIHSPKVSSTGVSLKTLKAYLLSQPGLSASARAAIDELDNPAGNLPIPIPADKVSTKQVTSGGVTYTEVGDNTGLGAGVIWIKNGVTYAVAGTISVDQALKVAENLH